ncbi:hypothetical protein AGR1A_Cc40218 [Agrobacterium fabacearum CFBP 5771]|nr:hypothetical protein AGR1A_Cc40218 [Agrobacterium fabacearum CFBP 5771]
MPVMDRELKLSIEWPSVTQKR